MSFMDKIKFWEKKPDFDSSFGLDSGQGFGNFDSRGFDNLGLPDSFQGTGMQQHGYGMNDMQSQQGYSQQQFGQQQPGGFEMGSSPSLIGNDMHDTSMGLDPSKITSVKEMGSSQGFHGSQHMQQQSQQQSANDYTNEKNMEIISAKLDMLKAAIESMNQRLLNIERIAMQDQEEMGRRKNSW